MPQRYTTRNVLEALRDDALLSCTVGELIDLYYVNQITFEELVSYSSKNSGINFDYHDIVILAADQMASC